MKRLLVAFFLLMLSANVFAASRSFRGDITGNAATVTTNANLTGDITSVGNATTVKDSLTINGVILNPGPTILTNGTFTTDTGWTKDAGWTIADGVAVATNVVNDDTIRQSYAATAGDVWLLSVTVSSFTGGTGGWWIYNAADDQRTTGTFTGNGTSTVIFIPTQTETYTIGISGATNFTANIDNLTMKKVAGSGVLSVVNGSVYLTGNIRIVIPTHANNAAAVAGGLKPGQLYRVNAATDPEPLYIVH